MGRKVIDLCAWSPETEEEWRIYGAMVECLDGEPILFFERRADLVVIRRDHLEKLLVDDDQSV